MFRNFAVATLVAVAPLAPAQSLVDPALAVDIVVPNGGGLSGPTNMAFIGATDILVNQKADGRVRRVINGTVQAGEVLDLPVNFQSERGLLGMALHPQFATNNLVYLYYTRANAAPATPNADGGTAIDNRVSRFTWNGTALVNEQLIISLPVTTGPNHDGGIITFGPPNAAPADQKLFIIIGDLNRNGQTQNYSGGPAPDNSGVVIRLNPDGSVPSGAEKGPFLDVAGSNASLQTMYAYGIRNSYGMDFDPVTNALWDTENGPGSNDEINRIDPAFNSGWEDYMGPTATEVPPPSGLVQFGGVGTYSNPEFTWEAVVAPTSIHFYRGNTLGSQYQFDAFVGCNNNSKLYRFDLSANAAERTGFNLTGGLADKVLNGNPAENDSSIVFGTNFPVVTDIRTGPDGHLYVLSLTQGAIYRIRPAVTVVDEWGLYR